MPPSDKEQARQLAEKITNGFLKTMESEYGVAGVETAMEVIKTRLESIREVDLRSR
jgi:hypothetical protein